MIPKVPPTTAALHVQPPQITTVPTPTPTPGWPSTWKLPPCWMDGPVINESGKREGHRWGTDGVMSCWIGVLTMLRESVEESCL
eukprot:12512637-Prorocentrum_lima.AAC.1